MNQLVAVVISEGFRLIGQIYRNRPITLKTAPRELKASVPEKVPELRPEDFEAYKPEEQATEIATGCIPCAIGHLGTCSGLLNEAMRFARSDGMRSDEVIDRVGGCLDELNAMERVDLRPEMLIGLPGEERELADEVLTASRTTRHILEAYDSVDTLEKAAADTQALRTQVFRKWIKYRMEHLTSEEQGKIQAKVIEKLNELIPEEEE